MDKVLFYFKLTLGLIILLFPLNACQSGNNPIAGSPSPSEMQTPIQENGSTQEPTPAPPTNTPIPLALSVNGFEISQGELDAELALYQAASGKEMATEDRQLVIDDLTDQALLAQAAIENGFVISESELQAEIDQLAESVGGVDALQGWMSTYGFSEEDFQRALSRSKAVAWMRDRIIASQPEQDEQVHARQILTLNIDDANQVYTQLKEGYDFFNLALEYDPLTAGDLGWFPRNYLPFPEIEEAAFSLEPGEFSLVIETVAGFHILEVIERETQKQLTSEMIQVLQKKMLQDWIEEQRSEADIIIY